MLPNSSAKQGVKFVEKSPNHYNFLGLKQSPKEYQFWGSSSFDDEHPERNIVVSKPDLLSNPNSSPNSASSSEVVMEEEEDQEEEDYLKNFKLISDSLSKTIPNCPKYKADEISATILKNKKNKKHFHQQSCCLSFIGNDDQNQAKEKTARELAKLLFGSQSKFISIGLSNFKQEIDEQKSTMSCRKRGRNEMGWNYLERFAEAVNENPHRVFFIEDIEQIDYCSLKGLKEAIEKGRVKLSDGEFCSLKDAIIIFNSQKKIVKQEQEQQQEENTSTFVSLDLNIAIEDANGDRIIRSIMEDCVDGKILFS